MATTIVLNKKHIRNFILSFVIGFIILFGLEHFGKFSYIANYIPESSGGKLQTTSYISTETGVSTIHYESIFGSKIITGGNGFNVGDLNYKGSDFDKYSNKVKYYIKATNKDLEYGLYFSIGLFLITIFFTEFKIKLS